MTMPMSPETIIHVVARFYQLKVAELICHRRHQHLIVARHVAMFLMRQMTTLSLSIIGAHFGGRDHATVLHAVESIESKIHEDDELRQQVAHLERSLRRMCPLPELCIE